VYIPVDVEKRLRSVTPERVAAEGIRLCVETIDAVSAVPGVAGIHLMALGFERGMAELIHSSAAGRLRSVPHAAPHSREDGRNAR
jgi:methylenetetrahydrofolate reductase (NADPH)